MKTTRWLLDLYEIKDVPLYPDGRDDIVEQTEDSLDRNRDFQYQLQAPTLRMLADKLKERARLEEARERKGEK
jgi:hypothetical protein